MAERVPALLGVLRRVLDIDERQDSCVLRTTASREFCVKHRGVERWTTAYDDRALGAAQRRRMRLPLRRLVQRGVMSRIESARQGSRICRHELFRELDVLFIDRRIVLDDLLHWSAAVSHLADLSSFRGDGTTFAIIWPRRRHLEKRERRPDAAGLHPAYSGSNV